MCIRVNGIARLISADANDGDAQIIGDGLTMRCTIFRELGKLQCYAGRESGVGAKVRYDRFKGYRHLQDLYEKNADDVISAGIDKFAAVLGADDDTMGIAYMSEINLGMASQSRHLCRIKDGIVFFRSRLGGDRFQDGPLHYTRCRR